MALIIAAYPFLMLIRQGQDTAIALLVLVAAWLRLRGGSDSRAGFYMGMGLFKFQLFIPLALLLAIWRPKILKGFTISGAGVALLSMVMVGPRGVLSYVSLLLRMAGNSTSAASEQYAMDARSMPNLRGLVYGIASGAGGAVPAALAKFVPIFIAVASFAIFVGAALILYRARTNPRDITDHVFAAALTVALVVSFHLQMHDLTLLTMAFALALNWMAGNRKDNESRTLDLHRADGDVLRDAAGVAAHSLSSSVSLRSCVDRDCSAEFALREARLGIRGELADRNQINFDWVLAPRKFPTDRRSWFPCGKWCAAATQERWLPSVKLWRCEMAGQIPPLRRLLFLCQGKLNQSGTASLSCARPATV